MNKIYSILCLVIACIITVSFAYIFKFPDIVTLLMGIICGFVGMTYAKIFWNKED